MITIKFFPDSDLEDFSEAIKEYETIWEKDGQKIISGWEEITSLKFRETFINAVIFDNVSFSNPLSLRFNTPPERKKGVLVHELGHRLFYKRGIFKRIPDQHQTHQLLFLVLYDLLVKLYGKEYADETVVWDKSLGDLYKETWEWALKFTPEERKQKFQNMLNTHKK